MKICEYAKNLCLKNNNFCKKINALSFKRFKGMKKMKQLGIFVFLKKRRLICEKMRTYVFLKKQRKIKAKIKKNEIKKLTKFDFFHNNYGNRHREHTLIFIL